MRSLFLSFGVLALMAPAISTAHAQATTREPVLPRPLEQQRITGSQVYYLGKHGIMNGWVLVRSGQPEFYYAPEDNSALILGILFDKEGNPLTPQQLVSLQQSKQRDITDMVVPHNLADENLATPAPAEAAPTQTTQSQTAAPSAAATNMSELKPMGPGQQLLQEVSNGAKVLWGAESAPTLYAFIDPNCVHCHHFLTDVTPLVDAGELAINILPVGYNPRSVKQAAFMLASADGIQRLMRYKNGERDALPEADVSQVAIQNNVAIQAKWGLQATPVIIYETPKGEVRLVRGRPSDIPNLINDLTGK